MEARIYVFRADEGDAAPEIEAVAVYTDGAITCEKRAVAEWLAKGLELLTGDAAPSTDEQHEALVNQLCDLKSGSHYLCSRTPFF